MKTVQLVLFMIIAGMFTKSKEACRVDYVS